jgi:hypothetical protein
LYNDVKLHEEHKLINQGAKGRNESELERMPVSCVVGRGVWVLIEVQGRLVIEALQGVGVVI